ncbi:hypothetical protein [Sinosporangium siamense]|uniref:Uncharacterized protein n=1 Tax=Sinosporangium siamense TaxID=1367973 RepID=A0A919V823_9ACTN|nr:hypothetical protein [Sinosporangium siamense]GII95715.1 hypothetical protein Ssi02_59460 [Sinosporangium siamense]
MAGETLPQVVERICARVVTAAEVRVAPLPRGGVRIWTEGWERPGDRWIADHQMLRELRLVGWETVVEPGIGLMVLGWNATNLAHRVHTLRVALGGLQNSHLRTAAVAISVTEGYRDAFPGSALSEIEPSVLSHISTQYLRWPARISDISGLTRVARESVLALLLAQAAQLEKDVMNLCDQHLAVAKHTVETLWYGLSPDAPSQEAARHTALREASLLTDRLLSARHAS